MKFIKEDTRVTCPVCGLSRNEDDVRDYIIGKKEILKRMCRNCYLTGQWEKMQ